MADRSRASRTGLTAVLTLTFAFLYIPIGVLVILSFNASGLPTAWGGASVKWYGALLANRDILAAALNTLIVGVVSTLIATILGTQLAHGARGQFGRGIEGRRQWAGFQLQGLQQKVHRGRLVEEVHVVHTFHLRVEITSFTKTRDAVRRNESAGFVGEPASLTGDHEVVGGAEKRVHARIDQAPPGGIVRMIVGCQRGVVAAVRRA